MNTEDFVSYEQAIKLKEIEFNWGCRDCFATDKVTGRVILQHYLNNEKWNSAKIGGEKYAYTHISAPTLAQVQKWMREIKKIDVLVWNCACGYGWDISKAGDEQTRGTTLLVYDDEGEDQASGMWLSYEKALSAGISKAIELLEMGK